MANDPAFIDFEDLDKIISVICYPTPSLVVKHVVSLKRKVPNKQNFGKEEERGCVFYYSLNNVNGLYLEYRGTILLEGHRNVASKEGASQYKKTCCYLDMKDFSSFLNRLDIVYSWLTGEQNKIIYQADSQGRPCKIIDISRKVAVSLSQSTYVAFKPCIIRDMSDVTYVGIAMGNVQGEITNFTASEFSSFRTMMHGLLPHLYLASNTLMGNAIQLSIYNKLKSFAEKR
jgi:hypothetical protein